MTCSSDLLCAVAICWIVAVAEFGVVVAERAVGFGGDPVLCAGLDHRGVGEVRVQFDLVDGRFDPGLGDDPFQVRGLEVRNADAAGAPVRNELGDDLPCRDIVALVERRKGPVNEEQVDLINAEVRHRLIDGALDVVGRVVGVGQLAGDVDLLAGEPGVGDRLTDPGLGAVSLGGVDVPVAGLQSLADRLRGSLVFSSVTSRSGCSASVP